MPRDAIGYVLALILVGGTLAIPSTVSALNRDSEPVVMTGLDLQPLLGTSPGRIAAFRQTTTWEQIPVQVDERAVADFGVVYGSAPVGFQNLEYTDAETFMGADPDPDFDADDELVFMARDTGRRAPFSASDPPGTVGDRIEVLVSDVVSGQSAYVYLYETDGSLSPGAGIDYVTYTFDLLSGDYLTTYGTLVGPNPEDSSVVTSSYRMHFSDRWIRDEIEILAGGASGADILDRHKNLFAPGICARSEDTFSAAEGAFFVNKDGPVRAIRSYMGANSGPLTQRTHYFYQDRHETRTFLRVHAIASVMDFYDYSAAATGMTYFSNVVLAGVAIDGVPDVVPTDPIAWEMVTGPQGTLIHAHQMLTDIPGFAFSGYYEDDATPATTQCTGDDAAYGSSGNFVDQPVPNTDPLLGSFQLLQFRRTTYVEAPGANVSLAQQRAADSQNPLMAAVVDPATATSPAATIRLSNHPNPFRGRTTIALGSRVSDGDRVSIYDLSGRLLRRLVPESTSGTVRWDGRDHRGLPVAAGVYQFRLDSAPSRAGKLTVLD